WWQGAKPTGYGVGHWLIFNSAYEQIAALQVGNGYQGGDLHEIMLTPRGTALVSIYAPLQWDLRPLGEPENGLVLDCIVQDLEIETGRVVFEWHVMDHVDLDESYMDVPTKSTSQFDYVHANDIDEDENGDLYMSLRHCHMVIKI